MKIVDAMRLEVFEQVLKFRNFVEGMSGPSGPREFFANFRDS